MTLQQSKTVRVLFSFGWLFFLSCRLDRWLPVPMTVRGQVQRTSWTRHKEVTLMIAA